MGVRSPIRSRDGKPLLAPEQDAARQPPGAPRPTSRSGLGARPVPELVALAPEHASRERLLSRPRHGRVMWDENVLALELGRSSA
jgi:hypothetical protein